MRENPELSKEIENQDMGLEDRLQEINEFRTLYNLHHDVWEQELLEPPFLFYYAKLLCPRERQILDGRIAGATLVALSVSMGISINTATRYIYNIRYVYRNKTRPRVNKFWKRRGG